MSVSGKISGSSTSCGCILGGEAFTAGWEMTPPAPWPTRAAAPSRTISPSCPETTTRLRRREIETSDGKYTGGVDRCTAVGIAYLRLFCYETFCLF